MISSGLSLLVSTGSEFPFIQRAFSFWGKGGLLEPCGWLYIISHRRRFYSAAGSVWFPGGVPRDPVDVLPASMYRLYLLVRVFISSVDVSSTQKVRLHCLFGGLKNSSVFPAGMVGLCSLVVERPKPLVGEGLRRETLRLKNGNVNPCENAIVMICSSMITTHHRLTLSAYAGSLAQGTRVGRQG